MPIVMLINLKGGVAKTTTSVAIAECLASEGFRTLLIDADHQCMAGELLLGEERQLRAERTGKNLHDLLSRMLHDDFDVREMEAYLSHNASNIGGGLKKLSVLPCSIRIDGFSTNMAKAGRGRKSNEELLAMIAQRRRLMRKWINDNFTYAVIDCPPSFALQVRFLLSVADGYVIPAIPERLSVRGSLYLQERIKSHGFKLDGIGTLWSMYREQNAVHRQVVDLASRGVEPYDRLPDPFLTKIPNATRIVEATEPRGAVASFQRKYTPEFSSLFTRACEEIVRRVEWRRSEEAEVISAASQKHNGKMPAEQSKD